MDKIMSNPPYDGPERRKYFRHNVIFAPRQKARLTIGDREFEVIDFSDGGLRFAKDDDTPLKKQYSWETDSRRWSIHPR